MLRSRIENAVRGLPFVQPVLLERDQLRQEATQLRQERERLLQEREELRRERERLLQERQAAAAREHTIDQFHRLYYETRPWAEDTLWLGTRTLKCPLDLWVYQELLVELRPDLIIECGTRFGGTTFYLASVCELLGQGRILGIDIDDMAGRPRHPRIEYLLGSTTDPEILGEVRRRAAGAKTVMAILDSDHSAAHVAAELEAYSALVTPGSYLIVEDTNLNGHPVCPEFGPGPMEAAAAFLHGRSDYAIDPSREKFLLTFNPRGFLRRAPESRA